jgi:hypothetical protein
MAAKKAAKKTVAILANERYGLYYGEVLTFDPVTRVAVVKACRHVARWYGRTGGITSLAVHGLCGPDKDKSRIGAPTTEPATLTAIVNVFPCSDEAQATFDDAKVQ